MFDLHFAGIKVATPPTVEPVTLTEAKTHLRVDIADDDTYITRLITMAREQCELEARRAFVTQTLEVRLERWPSYQLGLPMPPLQSITSITYTDEDGTTGTVTSTDYVAYTGVEPGRVVLKPSANWPSVNLMPGPSIVIQYVAGYGLAAAVPQRYKQAILLLVGHMYENREAVIVGTIAGALPLAVSNLLMTDRGSW